MSFSRLKVGCKSLQNQVDIMWNQPLHWQRLSLEKGLSWIIWMNMEVKYRYVFEDT